MDRIISIDLEKYIVYEHSEDKRIVACDMKHQSRLIELYRKYNCFHKVPDTEMIDVYTLEYDNKSNTYYLNENFKETIKINKLTGTIIGIYK